MVETTALELQQDLGDVPATANQATAPEGMLPNGHYLELRVLALEQAFAQRERTFQRLRELLSGPAGASGGAP